MEKQKILITGCEGTIGSVLMKYLKSDFELYGIDRHISNNKTDNIFKADIADYGQIYQVLQKILPINYIVHLAADPRVKAEWQSILVNNIVGTKNIYEIAKNFKVKRVIFASSIHVTGMYSLNEDKIITVHDPIRPDSDYAVSKVFGEAVARQYYELFGIESICLRLGAVLKDDNPKNIPELCKTWLSHRDLVQLIQKCLFSQKKFGIYYAVSINGKRYFDILATTKDLGYYPEDNALSKD